MIVNPAKLRKKLLKRINDVNDNKFPAELRQRVLNDLTVDNLSRIAIHKNQDVWFNDSSPILFSMDTVNEALFFGHMDLSDYGRKPNDNDDVHKLSSIDEMGKLHKIYSKLKTKRAKAIKARDIVKSSFKRRDHLAEVLSTETVMFLDVEMYERNIRTITEIGFTIVANGEVKDVQHFIIEEFINKRNKAFVPDHKDDFDFGKSQTMSLASAIHAVASNIRFSGTTGITHLIGHNIRDDISALTRTKKCNKGAPRDLVDSINELGVRYIDTALVSRFISESPNRVGIKRCLDLFEIDHRHLHNAGNDSYYNWLVAKNMTTFKKQVD